MPEEQDRTVTLRTLEIGDGTDYPFAGRWITGIGLPPVRAVDQPRGTLSGDVGGDDQYGPRTINVSCACDGRETAEAGVVTKSEAAMDLLDALKVAWDKSNVDIELTVEFAGRTIVYTGRPRGCEASLDRVCDGVIPCLLTFVAVNPFATSGDPIEEDIP